jgi:hypothetical protein
MIQEALAIPQVPSHVLSGKRIMQELGVTQGPQVKQLKARAEAFYEEALLEGRVLSEEELIAKLKKLPTST